MSHTHHHPAHDQEQGIRRLIWAFFVNVLLTVVQILGGVLSGSLALIADAVHNFSDAASLMVAVVARQWSTKPADSERTFGYRRAEIVGAMFNLTTLILIGLYLVFEAVLRFFQPQSVDGWPVVIIAAIALAVDVITVMLTYSLAKSSVNIRAAFIHNLADALGSFAVIISGTLIILYDWYFVDTLCTILIAGYVLFHALKEIRSVIRILMQSVPLGLDLNELTSCLGRIDRVVDVHHVHVWEIDEHSKSLEAHVVIDGKDNTHAAAIKQQIKNCLKDKFKIFHSTIEFEFHEHADETCTDDSVVSPH